MTEAEKRVSRDPEGIVFVDAEWELMHTYRSASRLDAFFEGLRQKTLLAGHVGKTGRVIFPPAELCEMTYDPVTDLVPVGPGGVVRAFAAVETQFPGKLPPPYSLAYVQLDGSDTASLGLLKDGSGETGSTREDLVGRRVKAVFADDPAGDWTDFWYELE